MDFSTGVKFENALPTTSAPQLTFNNNNQAPGSYSYDAAGNVRSDGSYNYTYDAEGNVTAVNGGTVAAYSYDALNHRVQTVTATANTYVSFNADGQRVASWRAGAGVPVLLESYAYWNGKPLVTYSSAGSPTYSHQDLLGTKRLVTDSYGNTVGSFQSVVYGDALMASGSDPEPSHFALLDRDSESATDHAMLRQYSPSSGQWMSPDPYDGSYNFVNPQSLNRYVYASNNPLLNVDPSGQFDCNAENTPATINAYNQCQMALGLAALAAHQDCSVSYSAACGSAPTFNQPHALTADEYFYLNENHGQDEAAYVDRVNERYFMDVAGILADEDFASMKTIGSSSNIVKMAPYNGTLSQFVGDQD